MRTCRHLPRYVSNTLLAFIGSAALCPPLAAAPVVRPDPAEVAAVERANETLSPTQALKNLEAKAGDWRVENGALVQADRSASHARTFIKGPRWVDCVIKAKVRVDAVGSAGASSGARLIVRGDEKTDTFYTVGLWAGGREVRIEKSRGLAFEPMTSNQFGTLASAPFPVELGKTYELTVVADHATIYCYIDGKFVVLAQEQDFTTQPVGRVGFFMNAATGAFSDVSIKGLKSITTSPVTPYAGNPVNVATYSPAVVKDDKYRMWDGMGRYAESEDGIAWTRPAGKEPVVNKGNTGDWPTGNTCGDPDVLKLDGHYWITFWSTCNRRNGAFDGMGIKRSLDGIHWVKWNDPNTTEPPFRDSDPVVGWAEYGQKGFIGVGAGTAMRLGDEVRIYHSMYDERTDIVRPEGVVGTGFATVKVDTLRQIVADAKAKGLLQCASCREIEATLDDPLPQSMWDDFQARVLAAVQAKQSGNVGSEKSALAEIAATRAKFTKALERYYEGALAPLKKVVDQLEAGRPVTEKVLWSLPAQRVGNNPPQIEFTGLNVAAGNHPVVIEIEAKCNRFDVARVAWATGDGFKAGQEMEFIAGYPGVESPTHRVTITTGGQPISALRLQFPAGATVDLKQVRIRELSIQPLPTEETQSTHLFLSARDWRFREATVIP